MVLVPGALHTLANADVSRVNLGPPAFRLRPTLTGIPPRDVHRGSTCRRVTRGATSARYDRQPKGTRSRRAHRPLARSPSVVGRPSVGRLGTRLGLPGSAYGGCGGQGLPQSCTHKRSPMPPCSCPMRLSPTSRRAGECRGAPCGCCQRLAGQAGTQLPRIDRRLRPCGRTEHAARRVQHSD